MEYIDSVCMVNIVVGLSECIMVKVSRSIDESSVQTKVVTVAAFCLAYTCSKREAFTPATIIDHCQGSMFVFTPSW